MRNLSSVGCCWLPRCCPVTALTLKVTSSRARRRQLRQMHRLQERYRNELFYNYEERGTNPEKPPKSTPDYLYVLPYASFSSACREFSKFKSNWGKYLFSWSLSNSWCSFFSFLKCSLFLQYNQFPLMVSPWPSSSGKCLKGCFQLMCSFGNSLSTYQTLKRCEGQMKLYTLLLTIRTDTIYDWLGAEGLLPLLPPFHFIHVWFYPC